MHMLPTRRAGGKTVPVVVANGRVLTDSADIVTWADSVASADRKLYPADAAARREVEAIEAEANERFGRATRLFAYHYGLPRAKVLAETVRPGMTSLQAALFPMLAPLAGILIRRRYRINDETAVTAAERIRGTFDAMSKRIEG
jgi:glutathione S-transferase